MNRNEMIIKAIKENNITPSIQEMMEQDIREAENKRRQEILSKRPLLIIGNDGEIFKKSIKQ